MGLYMYRISTVKPLAMTVNNIAPVVYSELIYKLGNVSEM